MFKIYIHTEQEYLGLKLIEQIKLQMPSAEVKLYIERTWAYEFVYARNCLRSQLQTLQTLMFPLAPKRRLNDSLIDQECHLYLGHSRPLNEFKIQLKSDHEILQTKLNHRISTYFKTRSKPGTPTQSVLKFGGAPPFVYEFLYWLVYQETQAPLVLEKVWDDDEDDLHLFIQDPKLRGELFRQNLKLLLYFDSYQADADQEQESGASTSLDSRREGLMRLLDSQLRHKGYLPTFMTQASASWPHESKQQGFVVNPIGFSLDLEEAKLLIEVLQNSLNQVGFDQYDYPVSVKSFSDPSFIKYQELQADKDIKSLSDNTSFFICVYLPVLQISQQRIYPVSGQSKQRWIVNIYHDQFMEHITDIASGVASNLDQNFSQQLIQSGFTRIQSSTHISQHKTKAQGGIYIDWGSAIDYPMVKAEFVNSFSHLSFIPPIIEESSDTSRNTIEFTYFSSDLDLKNWTQTLNEACQPVSLHLILNANQPYHGLRNIMKGDWQNIEVQSHYEYMNSGQMDDLDESGYDDLSDESWSFDESSDASSEEWEQSELQDWLMSSLHEQDYDQQADICILYGACPRFVIEWLKNELETQFNLEVDIQDALSPDDMEVIIEFAPHFDPKDSPKDTLKSYTGSDTDHSQKKSTEFTRELTSNQKLPVKGLIEAPYFAQSSERQVTQDIRQVQHRKDLLFYPYFNRLCEHLNTAIQQSESMIIQAPQKSGISSAFEWCSLHTDALLISPNDLETNAQLSAHKQRALNQIKKQKVPVVLVDRYDLFSDVVKIQINRAMMGLSLDQASTLNTPMMILSVSDHCTLNDLQFVYRLKRIHLTQPSAYDWQELLWYLFEQEQLNSILDQDKQDLDVIAYLSAIHERVHNTLTTINLPPTIDSFIGVLGAKRIIAYLKDHLLKKVEIKAENVPKSYSVQLKQPELRKLIESLYSQSDLGEYYSLIQFDELW